MNLSLQKKLLIILIALPTIAAGIYSFVAIDLFKTDKKAYIYESSASISRALADQVKSEIEDSIGFMRSILLGYNSQNSSFTQWSKQLFDTNENILYLSIIETSKNQKKAELTKDSKVNINDIDLSQLKENSLQISEDNKIILTVSNDFLKENNLIILSVFELKSVFASFESPSPSSNFLIAPSGKTLLGSKADSYSFENWNLKDKINFSHSSTAQIFSPDKKELLVSNSPINFGGLQVISVIETSKAFSAMSDLVFQSIIFLISIIAASTIISMFASKGLTSKLKKLLVATKEISKGNYAIPSLPTSSDEVGVLSSGFSTMAREIEKLMEENIEKARMETELKTAQAVQKTLFPASEAQFGNIVLSGFYEPASECGGDWWHYSDTGEHIILWIGDATGHGASAALITSAAKATSALIEKQQMTDPALIMETLNHAIYGAAKGEVCMTFFVATIDKSSKEITFCNASHEVPFVLPQTGKLTKSDFKFLSNNNHPRLGQDPSSQYSNSTYQLLSNELIYFYTDGVTELLNEENSMFGERRLVKSLINAFQSKDAKTFKESLLDDLYGFREDHPLEDDVTFFVIQNNDIV